MPTPDFITELRGMVGHHPLWLPGVKAVVLRGDAVLAVQRADLHYWSLPAGIVEPGEEPDLAVVREVAEETGVEVCVNRLMAVYAQPEVTYPNGDRTRYLTLVFHCAYRAGEAHVADDESLQVAWLDAAAQQQLPAFQQQLITQARTGAGLTFGEQQRHYPL